mgnify:CR=1 FL=1
MPDKALVGDELVADGFALHHVQDIVECVLVIGTAPGFFGVVCKQRLNGQVHELAVGQLEYGRALGGGMDQPIVWHVHFDLDGDVEFFHEAIGDG